jgi:hypothetical protein
MSLTGDMTVLCSGLAGECANLTVPARLHKSDPVAVTIASGI